MRYTCHELAAYLERLGFRREHGRGGGHASFARGPQRVHMPTNRNRGDPRLRPGDVMMVIRQLERFGVDRERARRLEP